MLYLGPHYSINEGVVNAIKDVEKIGGNAIQIFTGPPQSLNIGKLFEESPQQLNEIKKIVEKKFPLFIHAKYLLNFSKPLIPKNKIFLVRYVQDLDMGVKIGASGVVLHFGTASNGLTREEAIDNMAKSLVSCLDHADKSSRPILETSSGEGNYIGRTIEGMKKVYSKLPKKYQKRVMFCIDTCHIFVAGYPIHKEGGWESYVRLFEGEIGRGKIGVIHLNDSKVPFDGKVDMHEEIGDGYIFSRGLGGSRGALKEILEWADRNSVPCILETHRDFKEQIRMCRSLVGKRGGSLVGKGGETMVGAFRELMNFHKALGNIHQFQVYKNVVNKLSQMGEVRGVEELEGKEGFGEGVLGKVGEFLGTGRMKVLEEMRADRGLVALVELEKVYGIGPKLAAKLVKDGIMDVEGLRVAVKEGRVSLTENQRLGLKYFDDLNRRIPRKEAEKMVEFLRKKLKGLEVLMMGGYRLGKRDGKDLDLVVVGDGLSGEELIGRLGGEVEAVLEVGKNMVMVLMRFPGYKGVVHVDFRVTSKKLRAFAELYFGSGENFSRKIRQIAKDMGYTLNEYGLKKKNGKFVEGKFVDEKDIFKFLGVEYVKPENRL